MKPSNLEPYLGHAPTTMKLVVALVLVLPSTAYIFKRVGVVIAPGFELLDALGPYETLKEVQEGYYTQIDIDNHTWGTPTGIACDVSHDLGLQGHFQEPAIRTA